MRDLRNWNLSTSYTPLAIMKEPHLLSEGQKSPVIFSVAKKIVRCFLPRIEKSSNLQQTMDPLSVRVKPFTNLMLCISNRFPSDLPHQKKKPPQEEDNHKIQSEESCSMTLFHEANREKLTNRAQRIWFSSTAIPPYFGAHPCAFYPSVLQLLLFLLLF